MQQAINGRKLGSVQDARSFLIPLEIPFGQSASHLHADAQHGLGDFHMVTLQESLGICREVEDYQRFLILRSAQGNAPIGQLNNFEEGSRHKSISSEG